MLCRDIMKVSLVTWRAIFTFPSELVEEIKSYRMPSLLIWEAESLHSEILILSISICYVLFLAFKRFYTSPSTFITETVTLN